MAKKKGKGKSNTVPKSAAQKGAEAALYAAQQVGVESTRARGRQAAKGAFGARSLRAGGTSLQQYNLAKYKSDPFPGLGGNPNLGSSSPGPGPAAQGGRPAGPRSGAASADGKNRVRQQNEAKAKNRRKDNMNGVNIAEKMEAEAAAKAKAKAAAKAKAKAAAAAAAAKAKKKKQQKLTDSKGGVVKATGTKSVVS